MCSLVNVKIALKSERLIDHKHIHQTKTDLLSTSHTSALRQYVASSLYSLANTDTSSSSPISSLVSAT